MPDGDRALTFKNITLDETTHIVKKDGIIVHLRPMEYELVRYLMQNKNALLTPERIMRDVWNWHEVTDTNTLRFHISEIRKKLGYDVITTVHKYGYRHDQM